VVQVVHRKQSTPVPLAMGLAGVESPLGLFRVDSLSQCTVDISARGHASAAVPPMRPTQDTTEVTASAGLGSGMDRMVGEGDQDTGMGQLEASDKGRGRVQGTCVGMWMCAVSL